MEFGVVLQTNPPASRVVEMMRRAEDAGFSYGWTWDSHVLWQEPFVIYSAVLAATSSITVGTMVTNPGTRDWSVIASLFATLNDMYGNRTVCGIGRGDSARRVIGQPPMSLATLSAAMTVIKGLAEGREVTHHGQPLRLPWVRDGKLEIWMAAYGPRTLRRWASRPTASSCRPPIRTSPAGPSARCGRRPGRRAATRTRSPYASRRPPTSAPTWRTSGTSCRGSAAWWAIMSRTWWPGTARTGRSPGVPTDYIAGR